jgi:hypothetical protein
VPTAYRPDMLVRGVLKGSCGCVPGRGEVENASTFLASAVDEPSVFTAKEGRSDGKKLLSGSPRQIEEGIQFSCRKQREPDIVRYSKETRAPVAKSHD